jgi:hypothetical protein
LPAGGGAGGGGDCGGTYEAGGAVAVFHFSGGFSDATGANVRGNRAMSAGEATWFDTYSSATKKLAPLGFSLAGSHVPCRARTPEIQTRHPRDRVK